MISLIELVDIVIMSLFLGWLFEDFLTPKTKTVNDVVNKYVGGSNWYNSDFWFSVSVVAPSIIFHELAHKFVGLGFGYDAVFHAFYHNQFTFILAGVAAAMKLMNSGFLILVPGFVLITGDPTAFQNFWISFAGPLVHLLFFLGAWVLEKNISVGARKREYLYLTKKVNGLLFVFNMLPIAGFDGAQVFDSLFEMIG